MHYQVVELRFDIVTRRRGIGGSDKERKPEKSRGRGWESVLFATMAQAKHW